MRIAESDEDLVRCFPVVAELRAHVARAEFVARVRRQRQDAGYRLLYLEDAGDVKAVAGVRVGECLSWGRYLYVDDLVTREPDRGKGYGSTLLDHVLEYAKAQSCDEVHLDSGVQRVDAHRFYVRKHMKKVAYHFSLKFHETAGE